MCDGTAAGPHVDIDAAVARALVEGLLGGRVQPPTWPACVELARQRQRWHERFGWRAGSDGASGVPGRPGRVLFETIPGAER